MGLQYSLESRQNFLGIPDISKDRLQGALEAAVKKASVTQVANPKMKSKQGDVLRKCLAVSITELPPILVDHILQANKFDTALKLEVILESDELLEKLTEILRKAKDIVDSITSVPTCAGFIFAKKAPQGMEKESRDTDRKTRRGLLYDDFHPFVPSKFETNDCIEVLRFEGYNQTVDEFFSSLEGQKLENRLIEREVAAQRKLDAAKQDQDNRIKGLQNAQYQNLRKAAAIEANVDWVQEALDSINGLLDQGMDWVDIGKLVEREKRKNNPVANIICLPLNLAENTISIRLSEEDDQASDEEDPFETDDSDSESEGTLERPKGEQKTFDNSIIVEVLLTLSPWSNAREYYDQRKNAVVKEEKTQLQADKAIKSTEQKIKQDLKKVLKQEKALLQPIRSLMWFEKFYWFISSDGYLVVGAKDKSQAEILYRRHLRSGDVYVHSDAKEAAMVVIKNNASMANAPLPPATLSQAGQLSICASAAWDSKAGMGAWWVNAHQVTKTAPTGDLLQPGSFSVNGEKNFLPPGQLVLGLSVLFKISDQSKSNHTKHRIQDYPADDTAPVAMSLIDDGENQASKREEEDDGQAAEMEEPGVDDEDEDYPRVNALQGRNPVKNSTEADEETNDKVIYSKMSSPHVEEYEHDDEDDKEEDDDDALESVTDTAAASTVGNGTSSSASKGDLAQLDSKMPKRGQRRKAKKIAARYRDQDDDDRAAAEALIGSTTGKQKAEVEAQAKLQREEELEQAKARRRAQHEKKQKEVAEHEEKRRAILSGMDAQGDEEEEEKLATIDSLVGTPRPGDEILEAVVVCAPWAALGRCKYKFKMQPGSVKKGKAVKELLERWRADAGRKGALDEKSMDTEKMWPREVELIRFLKPEEIVNTVPAGKVRLMVVGANSGGGKGRGSGGGKGQSKGGKKGK